MLLPGLLLMLSAAAPSAAQEPGPAAPQALLQRLDERVTELGALVERAQAGRGRAETAKRGAERDLQALRTRAEQIEERLRTVGRTQATGILLRRAHDGLPSPGELRAQARARQDRIAEVDLRLVRHETELERLEDPEREAARLLELEGWTARDEETRAAALSEVRARLNALDVLLDQRLLPAELGLREALVAEDEQERELAETSAALLDALKEQLVWVRGTSLERDGDQQLRTLLAPASWTAVAAELPGGADSLVPAGALAVLALALFALRGRLRKRVRDASKRIGRYRHDRTGETLVVAGAELLRALPVPLLLLAAARFLEPAAGGALGAALQDGLRAAAGLLLPLVWLYHGCAPESLANRHFQWSEEGTARLRAALRWLVPVLVVAQGFEHALAQSGYGLHDGGFARLVFVAEQLTLAVFLFRNLAPHGPLIQPVLSESPNGWLARLAPLWAQLRVALPVGAAGLAALDWTFGAEMIATGTLRTLALALIVAVVNSLMHRWRRVESRRIAVEDAMRRREAATAADGAAAAEIPVVDEDKVDLPSIDAQTRQLFRTTTVLAGFLGLYSIWSVALPVLGILGRVEIWPAPRIATDDVDLLPPEVAEPVAAPVAVDVPAEAGDGGAALQLPGQQRLPVPLPEGGDGGVADVVTLQQVLVGILILFGTFVVVRNLTGLLEILLVRSARLAADSRLAISSLMRYTLTLLGVGLAFNAVGIHWSQVQWLAAALTFGLAFGLQEIFANFVSGLIILFERPVRIGDTVTVGEITGTVSRIRTRATTITDWDRKEMLVPNKSFITDNVVNWSLSDAVLRVSIDVGVSYSSDADQVRELLLEVARRTAHVLEDPEPRAVFVGFGDNALQFKLRVFIPDIEYLFDVRSSLHHDILAAFREAGVEISFPQRDLHIRSWAVEAAPPARPGS